MAWKAFKSDLLSLSSLQIAVRLDGDQHLRSVRDRWLFWWMMQCAMLLGFLMAYPMNGLLIRAGVKEAM